MLNMADHAHTFLAALLKRSEKSNLMYQDKYEIGRSFPFDDSYTDELVRYLADKRLVEYFGNDPQSTRIAITDYGRQSVRRDYYDMVR
jgi:sucrose-6-phosphate hydrolase SacC (GH32 family)